MSVSLRLPSTPEFHRALGIFALVDGQPVSGVVLIRARAASLIARLSTSELHANRYNRSGMQLVRIGSPVVLSRSYSAV